MMQLSAPLEWYKSSTLYLYIYLYIIFDQCRIDIIDQVESQVTHLVYTLLGIFFFLGIDTR